MIGEEWSRVTIQIITSGISGFLPNFLKPDWHFKSLLQLTGVILVTQFLQMNRSRREGAGDVMDQLSKKK